MSKRLLLVATLCLAACSSHKASEGPQALQDSASWPSERFSLPPRFAPSLPAGEQLLRFAPGMSDPAAQGFWSYVYLMRLEQSDLDAVRLQTLLDAYYDGLFRSFAEKNGRTLQSDPATVSVRAVGANRFEGQVDVLVRMASELPLELHLALQTESAGGGNTLVRVQASPQPQGHAIWTYLASAARSLSL